ncbi:helix-turn-helix transcriptional regulator [Paenibacillus sp. CGMCC 1.16610]|uniref:Helix-turn-helix domain-containing protein n=1 Tax=Paenibacillus anseongense TaxID=2682845 RepID=A0ABW9U1T1_9BACL|nr:MULTISPECIES: helix-turn-helix domain-containing protein [Paenibacillus]MBA2937068.1 helix-turn-helix transcriptional regulator [Paenibacillus sp. CGMCC 1.16610]MVQ33391.1 helix-turn-helix domain-containing protein [Paenibacillus anseongense]
MLNDIQERYYIESPEQATVLLNPIRGEIIAQLLEPGSAAEVARTLGETAQRINYHLKALEKAGLVQRVGTRQVRNLVEVLYRSIAKTFVLADSLSMKPETVQKLKDQSSLAHLVTTSERIRRDALLLMEQSDVGEEIPSATLQLQVHLCDEHQRQAFIEEYAAMVQQLVERYAAGKDENEAYQVLLAVYPKPKE